MILTKQLQAVIDSSLNQGLDYEDVRALLMKQGFQDADISDLFAQHRGPAPSVQQPKVSSDTDLGLMKTQTSTPPVIEPQTKKEQLFNKDFVHPEVKPGFVPVGFEKTETPQAEVKEEVQQFMNVGTNTQTAANLMAKEKLPAPGTVPLPSEMKQNEVAKEKMPVAVPTNINPSEKYINVGLSGMPEIEKVVAEEQAKKVQKSPWPLVVALIILIGLMGGFFYWFIVLNKDSGEVSESQKLLDELQSENQKQNEAPVPTTPSGPTDPFTGLPLEN